MSVASKMMLGFVVRRCAAELGREPSSNEFAEWANNQRDGRGEYRIFGRPITSREADVILRHPQRLVAIRAEGWEIGADTAIPAASNVIAFSSVRRRARRA